MKEKNNDKSSFELIEIDPSCYVLRAKNDTDAALDITHTVAQDFLQFQFCLKLLLKKQN